MEFAPWAGRLAARDLDCRRWWTASAHTSRNTGNAFHVLRHLNHLTHHEGMGSTSQRQNWTFLTNHARVLVAIARDPAVRLRDVAAMCGLTERTVQTIVTDLEADGYLRRVRDGRRNRYEISTGAVFRHPAEAGVQVAGLLALLTGAAADPDAPALVAGLDVRVDAPDEDDGTPEDNGAPTALSDPAPDRVSPVA
ncbi:MarR family transcriptional regulator [Streptomyces sp. NPDC058618]|uniref:MarR family transcriptional regulator n=2 Tax=Streptomyces TaxID=1883 RepID=UPI00365A9D4C